MSSCLVTGSCTKRRVSNIIYFDDLGNKFMVEFILKTHLDFDLDQK